ncbi:MAG: methyltransferase domain-containing protein, partial [Calditrichaeota bacterium]
SQIRVRVWTFSDEQVAPAFFESRLQSAVAYRTKLLDAGRFDAYRLVNSESDGLPGIVVDRYAGFLVCQFLSAGAEFWKKVVVEQLSQLFPEAGIYERSDAEVRAKEGLPQISGVLHGEEPPDLIEIKEDALRFLVDVKTGHKTGFYLDQRDNRISVREYCEGAEVLNGFAYTGAFGAWALHGGAAKVTNIESSAAALALAEQNVKLNGFDPSRVENIHGDMFQLLRQFRDTGRQFHVVILDPPRFVDSKGHLQRAARAYKDINLLALKLVREGGFLVTFSCSGLLPAELFQKIVADAALDANRRLKRVRRLTQSADHPIALSFPEASYLKGLICYVD